MINYYEILKISSSADQREIRQSYVRLARLCHPDKNRQNKETEKKAEEEFKLVSEAYNVLRDEEKRREYDNYLRRARENPQFYTSEETQNGVPRWERKQPDREASEELLRLALMLIKMYVDEQNRKRDLGKQLTQQIKNKNYDNLNNLIKEGAFLDEPSEDGYVGIHYAVSQGNRELLEILLFSGANVNAETAEKDTALHIAVNEKNFDFCVLLLSFKAKTHLQNHNGSTALHDAISNNCSDKIIKLLIKNHNTYIWFLSTYDSLDCKDSNGNTPLHIAIINRKFNIVSLLLNNHAKYDLKNKSGFTAINLLNAADGLPQDLSIWLERKNLKELMKNQPGTCQIM